MITVQEQARELGVALANSPEFIRMKQAQAALAENEPLSGLINELQEKRQQIVSILGNEGDTDGLNALSLTNDIERLQGQLTENPVFQELIDSEEAFSTLLHTVDEEINTCIGSERTACSGDCGSCGGCKH